MNKIKLPIRIEAIPFAKVGREFKFLLVKRLPKDGGFWQPVTGTLESDEDLLSCLYRELFEEISIDKSDIVSLTDMFYSFTWQKNGITITEYVYAVELQNERDVILSDEHEDKKWCNFEEALILLEKDDNKKAYMEFKRRFMNG